MGEETTPPEPYPWLTRERLGETGVKSGGNRGLCQNQKRFWLWETSLTLTLTRDAKGRLVGVNPDLFWNPANWSTWYHNVWNTWVHSAWDWDGMALGSFDCVCWTICWTFRAAISLANPPLYGGTGGLYCVGLHRSQSYTITTPPLSWKKNIPREKSSAWIRIWLVLRRINGFSIECLKLVPHFGMTAGRCHSWFFVFFWKLHADGFHLKKIKTWFPPRSRYFYWKYDSVRKLLCLLLPFRKMCSCFSHVWAGTQLRGRRR